MKRKITIEFVTSSSPEEVLTFLGMLTGDTTYTMSVEPIAGIPEPVPEPMPMPMPYPKPIIPRRDPVDPAPAPVITNWRQDNRAVWKGSKLDFAATLANMKTTYAELCTRKTKRGTLEFGVKVGISRSKKGFTGKPAWDGS